MKTYQKSDPKQLENIPQQLQELTQWVCWRQVKNPKRQKPDKPPVDVHTGDGARSNDPNTWATWDEVISYLAEYDEAMGVGFETNAADPYTFIDLDDCRDPQTKTVADWALHILDTMKSYSEISPSGTGIRIAIEAKLASNHANRRGKIELYSHSQYLTMTGNRLEKFPKDIEKRQKELETFYQDIFGKDEQKLPEKKPARFDPKLARVQAISDDDLIARAAAAVNGAKFLSLWGGEVKDHNSDHSSADAALCSILTYWTRADAVRVDQLFRKSKLFRPKWDTRRGGTTYGERTVAFAIGGASALYDPDLDLQLAEGHNDIANAETFVLIHADEFLWHLESKMWLGWNCHHWEPFQDLRLLRAAEDVSQELLRRATLSPDPDARLQARRIKWAVTSGDKRRRDAIESYSRGRANVHGDDLDANKYLLCCANGVVDLELGELRDGTRSDRCVRTTGIYYDPDAICPIWDQFLFEIMEGDEEMIQYLWRVIGYATTGDTTERSFFLFHGDGRNGKSTFVETLKAMLGPPGIGYAQKARFSTFLKKGAVSGAANDDVAFLAGSRVVVANEADEKMPLDVALVKELTGGDTHRARFLYGREFEFVPQFKLFLVTNKIPPIRESTYAIWDRLHYVKFNFRVEEKKKDRKLPLKLLGELSGILAKAVQASLEWQHGGLRPPQKVLDAGKELETDNDPFAPFLEEMTEAEEGTYVLQNQLHNALTFWWKKKEWRSNPPNSKTLNSYMKKKVADGVYWDVGKKDNVQKWGGLRLKNPPSFYEGRQPGDDDE